MNPPSLAYRALDAFYNACILALVLLAAVASAVVVLQRGRGDSPAPPNSERDTRSKTTRPPVRAASLSPDGDFLDVLVGGTTWLRCDAHTGQELSHHDCGEQRVHHVSMRSHDRTWAGISEPAGLFLESEGEVFWNGLLSGQQPNEAMISCSLCAQRNLIVAVSNRGAVWRIKFDEGRFAPIRRDVIDQRLSHVALSPRGDCAALVTVDGDILIWDVERESLVEHETRRGPCRFASWSGDGQWLLGYGVDQGIFVWREDETDAAQHWRTDSQVVAEAALSFDGRLLAAGEADQIRLWDVVSGGEICRLDGHGGIITCLVFTSDGRALFSCDTKGRVCRWSLADQRVVWSTQ